VRGSLAVNHRATPASEIGASGNPRLRRHHPTVAAHAVSNDVGGSPNVEVNDVESKTNGASNWYRISERPRREGATADAARSTPHGMRRTGGGIQPRRLGERADRGA